MKTSYFNRLKEIKYPIAICGKSPDFYNGPEYKKVAPKLWFFKEYKNPESPHYLDEDYYMENYLEYVLGPLDPRVVWEELCSIYPEVDSSEITLLCYERPESFCHRHLLSAWLRFNGFDIEEKEEGEDD